MNKELYVSTTPHETKVALVEDDQLAEVYFERENEYTLAGSIYKGRVTRVLPGMQSAFVDIGLERDAFLYVSDFLELQDEEEDGEFADVKVTGAVLASANGLIVTEPLTAVEEDSEDAEEEPAAVAEGDAAPAEGKDANTSRWRGRRRRRGRRGGRERVNGDRPAEAQPGTADYEAQPPVREIANESGEDSDAEAQPPAAPPRKRELRGFEPRGLVVHGLARNVEDADAVAPEEEFEAEEAVAPAEAEKPQRQAQPAAPAASSFTPMLLPGESISKYNRGEGEAPAMAPAAESGSEDAERGGSYGRDRDRGDRDRGGRGRRGDRDRGRGRDRGDREPREPRERENIALPENYTPIVLPGESISKYRGVEPVAMPVDQEFADSAPAIETEVAVHQPVEAAEFAEEVVAHEEAAPANANIEPEVASQAEPAEPVAQEAAVPEHVEPLHVEPEANSDEPLTSASYSGASGLPSLTQRHVAEVEEIEAEDAEEQDETEEVVTEHAAEAAPEVAAEDATQAAPEVSQPVAEVAQPEAVATSEHVEASEPHAEASQAEAVHAEVTHAEVAPITESTEAEAATAEGEVKPESRGRRSWRDRVSKIFGAAHGEHEFQPVDVEQGAHAEQEPATESHSIPSPAAQAEAEAEPVQSQFGSFIIEGGNVEHE